MLVCQLKKGGETTLDTWYQNTSELRYVPEYRFSLQGVGKYIGIMDVFFEYISPEDGPKKKIVG